ncbi:uncharacterized protein LOC124437424 [Xenia sp. Carnegie-2017]|uniref:uncharacterized protein LOC124437424 n=1 Tax=Xenia sp. Carnegie-2017 TaxID=2897299 RepID=UPI001F03ABFF|nr:uncharacterized protein LOC124437424 [Xenia sp. Carnegie-2017]
MADASSSKHVEQAFISSPSILAEHFTDLNVDLCAREFSNYLNVNLSSQVQTYQDIIEDMLVRLEELSQTADMIQNESEVVVADLLPRIILQSKSLPAIFQKIEHLERFMKEVSENIDKLEEKVKKAETDLETSTVKGFLKRFQQKKEIKKSENISWVPVELTNLKQYFRNDKTSEEKNFIPLSNVEDNDT